jgi:transcriptional regulator with GAF, ATPase, and Fis domain
MPEPEVVVGARHGLRSVLERVAMVAPSDLPVLLFGETGTGKEVVARVIHDGSVRCDGPFWRVNCGALSPELVDSELFGHERGSFTGAIAKRKGWFEQAHGGTLFLDEVAELSPAVQVRLLRVLQEGELVRVGGAQTIAVDVRIVAATHRDLAGMVEARQFRADLFYRISAFPIVIPPLRERGGDLAELATYFAARAARRFELPALSIEPHDVELLRDYSWPGNVRELASVIDRAVLLGEGRRIDIARSLHLSPRPASSRGMAAQPVTPPPPPLPLPAGAEPPGPTAATTAFPALASPLSPALRALPVSPLSSASSTSPASSTFPASSASPTSSASSTSPSSPSSPSSPTSPTSIEPLDDVIRSHIDRALVVCQGRIDGPFGAARKLAINPHTLRARMRKLGIDWRRHRRA